MQPAADRAGPLRQINAQRDVLSHRQTIATRLGASSARAALCFRLGDALDLSGGDYSSRKSLLVGGLMVHRPIVAFAILAFATSLSSAAETPEERQACTNDANTLCPDEIPDRGRVYACLIKKINQLSPACKKVIRDSIAPPQRRR